jgi:polar amino acid transport system substrate-binding protein
MAGRRRPILVAGALLGTAGLAVGVLLPGGPSTPAGPAVGPSVVEADPAALRAAGDCNPRLSLDPGKGSRDGDAVQRIKKRGKLIAGIDQNSFLWGFRDPSTGNIQGFDIDLVKELAQEILGDREAVTLKTVPTGRRQEALKERQVDVVVRTMTITCDRIKGTPEHPAVAFSSVYFEAGQQVLAPKSSGITGFDNSLKGRRVCTAEGSTGLDLLKANRGKLGLKIRTVPNQLDCLVRLQLGKVDAVVSDSALLAGQAAQDPAVRLVGKVVGKEPYGIAVNSKDDDLVRAANSMLARVRDGGKKSIWMRNYDRWLRDDLGATGGAPHAQYKD